MGKRGPKPKPADELRTVCVACRLTAAEAEQLDQGKPDYISRGEWLRHRALSRQLPRPIPEINRQAWRDLARAAGNLATVATAMRGGDYVEVSDIKRVLADVRNGLIGIAGGDQ